MADSTILTLTILRSLTVVFGGIFLWYTGRSYLKHRNTNLLILFLAIGTMVLGAVTEGALRQFFGASYAVAHITESVFLLLAFMILVLSVLVRPSSKVAAPAPESRP